MKKSYYEAKNLISFEDMNDVKKRHDMEKLWILKDIWNEEIKSSLEQIKK